MNIVFTEWKQLPVIEGNLTDLSGIIEMLHLQ